MEVISTILYKVTIKDIKKLPVFYTVLQHNKTSDTYRILKTNADYFPCMSKFEYFLFTPPPLPKLKNFANDNGAKV